MNDWLRSVTVLAVAFIGVVALTIGLGLVIVPDAAVSLHDTTDDVPVASHGGGTPVPSVAVPLGGVGGTLLVDGDREGRFTVDRESIDGRYGLIGDDGRIFFEDDPVAIAQMSFDGLEFFPDPGECAITPGERDDTTGIAPAHVRCEDIEDVRGNGVVTMDGTLGVAADVLGMRGGLPPSGGTVEVDDATLVFEEARLVISPFSGYAGTLWDRDMDLMLSFTYSGELVVEDIIYMGTQVSADPCTSSATELGRLNPHTLVVDFTLRCDAVEVSDAGTVSISGSIVIEEVHDPR